jgi:hypothetical protein
MRRSPVARFFAIGEGRGKAIASPRMPARRLLRQRFADRFRGDATTDASSTGPTAFLVLGPTSFVIPRDVR